MVFVNFVKQILEILTAFSLSTTNFLCYVINLLFGKLAFSCTNTSVEVIDSIHDSVLRIVFDFISITESKEIVHDTVSSLIF